MSLNTKQVEYIELINKQFGVLDTNEYKNYNKIYKKAFDLEKELTSSEIDECLLSEPLNEWLQIWANRSLYIRTKNKSYISLLQNLYEKTKNKNVRVEVGTFLRSCESV